MVDGGDTKMIEKMVEMFTSEMITITIVSLTAFILFMFLMLLITIASLSRVKKRLSVMDNKFLELEEQHASKLKEHDTLLGQAGQTMGKEAADFNQMAQRIYVLEEEFQALKAFQSGFEQIRNQIVEAFGATQAKRPSQNTLTTERKAFKEETLIPSEGKLPDKEDLDKYWMHRHQQPPRAV
jgi:hypothetical protein